MPRAYTVREVVGGNREVTVRYRSDIPDAIRPWFADAPEDVREEIASQIDLMGTEDYPGADTYLGVRLAVLGPDDLLTTGQVASLRGRSISEIGKQARKGRIPVTMTLPGNRALIRVADALAWEPRPAHRPRRQG